MTSITITFSFRSLTINYNRHCILNSVIIFKNEVIVNNCIKKNITISNKIGSNIDDINELSGDADGYKTNPLIFDERKFETRKLNKQKYFNKFHDLLMKNKILDYDTEETLEFLKSFENGTYTNKISRNKNRKIMWFLLLLTSIFFVYFFKCIFAHYDKNLCLYTNYILYII